MLASEHLDAVLTLIKEILQKTGIVRFLGFGTFKVKRSIARTVKTPLSDEPINIPASNRVTFSAGKKLKQSINVPKESKAKK